MKFLSTAIQSRFIKIILIVLLVVCEGFFIYLAYFVVTQSPKNAQQQNTKIEASDQFSDEVRCADQNLRLDEASEKVNGNPKALSILKEKCLWLMRAENEDFDGDGKKELLIYASGAGCGSCHLQDIYIIKDNEVIFYKLADDPGVRLAEKYIGFEIREPTRKDNEAMCCPSEGIIQSYRLRNGGQGLNTFYKFSEKVEPYNKPE